MNIYAVVSIVEGFLIVCMLGWEIFWLRRMFQVLWRMPTAQQLQQMVDLMQKDGQAIRGIASFVVPSLFSSGNSGSSEEKLAQRK